MARVLTDRQKKFIEVLFDEAGGDIVTAKKLAGYSDNTPTTEIVTSLKEEILDATHMYMARNAPKAAMSMVGALYEPTELGIRDKMAAAKELLETVAKLGIWPNDAIMCTQLFPWLRISYPYYTELQGVVSTTTQA